MLTILPFAAGAMLLLLAEGGSHLLSLGPAETLHELVYGRAPGTICVTRFFDPDEPLIAREIHPETKFIEMRILGEPGDPHWELRGLAERQPDERIDLILKKQ